ncbi:rhodanese-like domain-containing protein [Algoriphagus kandeliae]|uniref:Rhodanese-like domain-containing protein n=1 Tax=Algoriphagus kandeliae TaxID=2562278 RepID=A0A4Y9QLB9_9BACT|nr:rhodanese-like domain-containing protein [Algoriphagus kandeliae]TFV92372.1 rhodanese-like domain-containing protein [Algoriphagus kandeliae]
MNSQFLRLCLAVSFFIVGQSLFAQSIAYKTLLNGLYDKEFPVLMPSEIQNLSDFQILDTREKEEFDVSHLKGAINVGYDHFSISQLNKLDPKKPVLVYCTVGARSQDIGKKLAEKGFQVYNLYGGIFQWVNDGKEVYDQSGKTNRVHTYNLAWSVWLEKGEKVY